MPMLKDPLEKKQGVEVASCLDNWILIRDGTSQYHMENEYWHLELFLM